MPTPCCYSGSSRNAWSGSWRAFVKSSIRHATHLAIRWRHAAHLLLRRIRHWYAASFQYPDKDNHLGYSTITSLYCCFSAQIILPVMDQFLSASIMSSRTMQLEEISSRERWILCSFPVNASDCFKCCNNAVACRDGLVINNNVWPWILWTSLNMMKLHFLVAHLTAVSTKIEAPEVLTDVALLCRNKISTQRGENIKTNGLQLISI